MVSRVNKDYLFDMLHSYGVEIYGDFVVWVESFDGDLILAQNPLLPNVIYVSDGSFKEVFKLMIFDDKILSVKVKDPHVVSRILSKTLFIN